MDSPNTHPSTADPAVLKHPLKDHFNRSQPSKNQHSKEEQILNYSYYINPCTNPPNISQEVGNPSGSQTRTLSAANLREGLLEMNLEGYWNIMETAYGLILSFERKYDAEEVFENMEVAKVLEGPVQVTTLPNIMPGCARGGDNRKNVVGGGYNLGRYNITINQMSPYGTPRTCVYQPSTSRLLHPPGPLMIRDVPWSIPVDELRAALLSQGIQLAAIERYRQHIRIEVKNIYHYEQLLSEGLNFYNSGRFAITGERPGSSGSRDGDTTSGTGQDDVLQCYRCQGFWHVAANCRHLPRCVRCGEPHGVEYCNRARGNPLCCNCSGAHHAAYKNCPVRKNMAQAAPVAFVLSRDRPTGSFAEVTAKVGATKPKCML